MQEPANTYDSQVVNGSRKIFLFTLLVCSIQLGQVAHAFSHDEGVGEEAPCLWSHHSAEEDAPLPATTGSLALDSRRILIQLVANDFLPTRGTAQHPARAPPKLV